MTRRASWSRRSFAANPTDPPPDPKRKSRCRRRSPRPRAEGRMIEAVMFWNEPNNKSHWDLELDPGWTIFSEMTKLAADAVRAEQPKLTRVLGGISPIDPSFLATLQNNQVLDHLDAVAVHGFPLDWNL